MEATQVRLRPTISVSKAVTVPEGKELLLSCQGRSAVKEGGSAACTGPDAFCVASAQPVGNMPPKGRL